MEIEGLLFMTYKELEIDKLYNYDDVNNHYIIIHKGEKEFGYYEFSATSKTWYRSKSSVSQFIESGYIWWSLNTKAIRKSRRYSMLKTIFLKGVINEV